jgi:dTDP-4-amino-4,6-dideoxygalactose transaminase
MTLPSNLGMNEINFNQWPLGHLDTHDQRLELSMLSAAGYSWQDPYDIVEIFEKEVAEFAGAKYAVAVDCCSHGLFLCLKYLQAQGTITIPAQTYVSVPMQILHAGCQINFEEIAWSGTYQLKPYPIWDSAVRWRSGMYQGDLQVLSFQIKKRLPIGRGGMILTDSHEEYQWFKRACHDGRNLKTLYVHDVFTIGWHYYMTPEDAARGLILLQTRKKDFPDSADHTNYVDLRNYEIFKK